MYCQTLLKKQKKSLWQKNREESGKVDELKSGKAEKFVMFANAHNLFMFINKLFNSSTFPLFNLVEKGLS